MTRDEVMADLPDGWLRAAIRGLPQTWKVIKLPEDLPYEDAQVVLMSNKGDDFIPANTVLMTSKAKAEELEQDHDIRRAFTYMTDEEKREALGD